MSAVTPRRVLPWSGRSVFWALAPVALTTFVVLGPLRAPVAGSDEGLLLVHPDSVARGEVPNRDFATVYGPMTYWLLAGVYRLLGHTLVVERSVGVAYRVAIAVAVVLLLRRSVHPVAASLAGLTSLLLASIHFPLAYAYHGALACALIGLCLLTTQRDTVRFVGGLALGLAAAFRPEMGVLSLASVPLLMRMSWRWPLAGWGLGLLPLLAHLVTGGRAVLDDVLLGRAGVNSQVGPPGLVLLAAALGVVVCAVVLWVVGRRCDEPALVALGVTGILLVPNMVQRLDLHHVLWPASVVVSATVAVLASRSPWLQEGPVRLVPVLSAAAFAAVLGVPALVHGSPVVEHAGRSIHVAPEQLRPTRAVLATVDAVSTPDDVVFVGAQDLSEPVLPSSWLYHLLPAHPRPFRYEEFLPGRTEQAGSGLLEDLRSADVLVLEDLDLLGDHLTPYVPRGPQTANQLVQREFCPVARHGDAVVMVRRDRCERARDATGAAGPVVPRPPSGAVVRQ
jgi:hypothetical protein